MTIFVLWTGISFPVHPLSIPCPPPSTSIHPLSPPMFCLGYSYLSLPETFYSRAQPEAWESPSLVVLNIPLCQDLGIDPQAVADYFLKPEVRDGMPTPFAQAYAGHQFGHFTRLGDGRALVIGERDTPDGRRVDLQLKGSGPTAYSRGGDGQATLRAMLREYLISEAMHHLDVDSSRSLAVVRTGRQVRRESLQEGAVLLRVMVSHIRVGTFEYAARLATEADLRALADYSIHRLYPQAAGDEHPVLSLFHRVMQRQVDILAHWMRVGFIHGVMNTDNTAISGETFDYGPCAFLNAYHPATRYSSIDRYGRYAFGRQPQILQWNLTRWMESLLPLLHTDPNQALTLAQKAVDAYPVAWRVAYSDLMCQKIGLPPGNAEGDTLFSDLLLMMERWGCDYTQTFHALTYGAIESVNDSQMEVDLPFFATAYRTSTLSPNDPNVPPASTYPPNNPAAISPAENYVDSDARCEYQAWHKRWIEAVDRAPGGRAKARQRMQASNPVFIPRNHRVEEALDEAEAGRFEAFNRLLEVVSEPYRNRIEFMEYSTPPGPGFEATYQTFCGT